MLQGESTLSRLIMKTLETLSALVRQHDIAWFQANHPGPFLLRRRNEEEIAAEPRYGTFLHLPAVKVTQQAGTGRKITLPPRAKSPGAPPHPALFVPPQEKTQSLASFQLHPITKTQKNTFSNGITIGRTQNNDIVIPLSSISKFHAWVQIEPGSGSFLKGTPAKDRFYLFDAHSRYGTFVDGARVSPDAEEGVLLTPGATVQIGDASLTFLDAEGLYQWLSQINPPSKNSRDE